jgi:hypothetical protein
VHGGVGSQLRDAEDHVVGDRAPVEQPPQVGADLADVLGPAGIGAR